MVSKTNTRGRAEVPEVSQESSVAEHSSPADERRTVGYVSFEQTLAESPELRAYLESDEGKSGMRELVLQHQIYKLRTLRKSLGITQVQLAARLGVSQIRISQIENGRLEKFELGTLIRYVEALGGELELGVAIAGRRINLLDIEQADAADTAEAG